ncbi:hypothetical protein CAT7_00346 [Carnobacterium sp. AT7]|uniref:DUF1189 domain-containing protein n=1 Tax=Carnobacterium TaxID=2747 RepID=UPI00015F059C|nr:MULTISPECIES: hypothetical protein [Carnobacterium]EDP67204.1 hypothetical protein CAT7_00346 [Carnobacterium sp. AT7]
MKSDVFPLNYFKSIWSPKQIFKNRHQLNWFQIFVVLLFVNSLLMIPVALNYVKMDTFPVEDTLPGSFGLIDEAVVLKLQAGNYENGTLKLPESFVLSTENGMVSGLLTESETDEALSADNALLFQETEFVIKEGDQSLETIPYTKDFDLSKVTTVAELKEALSRQWFIKNKAYTVATLMSLVFSITLVSTLFLTFGSAIFLYLTKKSKFSSINSYKESVNLLTNCIGLPSFVALLLGLIQFDIIIMLMIQSVGLVMMLLIVFYQTRFNDKTSGKEVKKAFGGKSS